MKQAILAVLTLLVAGLSAPSHAFSRSEPPQLQSPGNGAQVATFGPILVWALPESVVTQLHLQVNPANNDGPGLDLIVSPAPAQFALPAPPAWFGLLPDMGYTWRVRVSDATTAAGADDPSWSDWSDSWVFRTPALSGTSIGGVSPQIGAVAGSLQPSIVWSDTSPSGWYYEIQLSKDPEFGPNAFLYAELRHGALTSPPRSYAVPSQFPLEPGLRYHWRVRPRVQGDGSPAAWSPVFNFMSPGASAGGPGGPGGRARAQVTAILSGDSIEVNINGLRQRVRYLGITAPSAVPPECFGAQAAARNSELVEGQLVDLERDSTDADASGRLLRYVYLDATMINAQLVSEGFARVVSSASDTRNRDVLLQKEAEARSAARGLWAACSLAAPQ
ncbi:MAG: hypothetical protein EXR51_00660 [Dehalococcoidia bacterium]|nr:hypothetical protein [Dehalococcoidia bacterium]